MQEMDRDGRSVKSMRFALTVHLRLHAGRHLF